MKGWFQRGMKPLATQFAAWIDSFWHKTDTIPTANIEGLEDTLNKKAEQMDVNNLYADFVRHRADDTKHKTIAEQGKLDNLAANPNTTYATRAELEQLSSNSIIIIPADFTKGSADMEAEIIATVQERLTDGTLFSKPVYLLYKWKKDYTSEDAPVYYGIVSKSNEKWTEGNTYPNVQMLFNSSIVVTSADAPEYPAAYCIIINIRGTKVRIAYQNYEDQHPVYGIELTEDGNGIINSADKNWYELYKELTKGNHPQVSLKTPDSGMYCPASYEFTPLDESLESPIFAGTMEISYLKEIDGRQELWVETRVFTDLSAATGTYNWENYLKKFSLTIAGGGGLVEGDTKDCIVTFPDQDARTNIASGEKHSVLFGKLKRWFADLKAVAFTGRAADLTQDADNRLVTDAEKAGWADKYTRAEVDNKDADGLQAAKEYAAQKVAEIVGSAPETLDTLNELAAALGNDPNFATSIMALIGGKADLVHTHSKAQITDFPAALPANGGNADTVDGKHSSDLFVSGVLSLNHSDLDTFVNRTSGTYRVYDGDSAMCLIVFRNPAASASGVEMYVGYGEDDHIQVRKTVDSNRYTGWKTIAYTTDIPSLSDVIKSTGDQTINGKLNLNSASARVVFKSNDVVKGSSGMSDIASDGIILWNAESGAKIAAAPDGKCYSNNKEIATKDQIPTSLPANGGNADTLGGLDRMSFGRVFYPIDVDDTKGFVSAGYTPESGGTRPGPGTYGSILQVSNNIQGPAGGDWVFQIAHAHGEDRPYWRTQFNRKGWTEWKRLAFVDDLSDTLKNSGEQTLSNGRFNMLVSAPEHVLMFKDATGNIGYIGFGAYPTKDIQIMNYATGKYVSIAADGKLYYDNKELAFKDDIAGTTLMLDTRDTPEAIQNNIAVFKATFTLLSTRVDIPRIGISLSEELGYSTGHRLWAIGAAQMEGVAIKFTFCGLDSSDMIQYMKVIVTSAGLLTITPVPH